MGLFLASCLVFFWAPVVVHSSLFPGRADSLPALQMLKIPLTFHTDGSRYSVDVTMSPNSSQPQHFKFALSTSTGYTYVAGPQCSTCGGATEKYNQSISNSFQQGPSQEIQNVTVLDQQVKGVAMKEACVLKTTSAASAIGGWSYPNQTVVVAQTSSFSNTSGIDGLIGLGTLHGGSFLDTPPGQWLKRNPGRTNFTYGMQLNQPSENDTVLDGGLLHWFMPDTSAYTGDPVYKSIEPRTPATMNTTVNGVSSGENHNLNTDWVITLDAFTFAAGAGSYTQNQTSSSLKAILDPYYPDIYFPQIYSKLIYSAVSGASVKSAGSATNIYTVPCDQKMSLSVTFGRFTISLSEAQLVKKQSDGTCVGTIQEWSDQAVSEFLFGSSFISNVYLIFVITEDQAQVGFAARSVSSSSSGGLSKGAIAGIAVGSAVGGGLIIGGILFFLLRKCYGKPRSSQPNQNITPFDGGSQEITIKESSTFDPYSSSPITPALNSSRPLLSSTSDSGPSPSPPATPQSPEWRHLSYGTYQGGATASTSSQGGPQQIAPPGRLETIPDSPPPYLHSGAPWLQPPPSSARRQKEIEANEISEHPVIA